MSTMNRRRFLELLGVSATATVLAPPRLLGAKPPAPEFWLSEHAFVLADQSKIFLTRVQVAPFILPAPAGTRCRAVIRSVLETDDDDLVVATDGVRVFNDPGEVVLDRVGYPDGPNMLASEFDAAVLRSDEMMYPIDWGVVSKHRPLQIDYQAFPGEDRDLYLAIFYQAFDPRTSPCPPATSSSQDPLEDVDPDDYRIRPWKHEDPE